MAVTTTYSVWLTIRIAHSYFRGNADYLHLAPTPCTAVILNRVGALLKKMDTCTWIVLRQDNKDDEELLQNLEFNVKVTDANFYYYTDAAPEINGSGWKLIDAGTKGIWKILTISTDNKMIIDSTTVEILINSPKKFLEFLVLPKLVKQRLLELKEETNQLKFDLSTADFPGQDTPVYRFISNEQVELKQTADYKISLWEKKEKGEVLLSNSISLPKAMSRSILSPNDTISSYFYF